MKPFQLLGRASLLVSYSPQGLGGGVPAKQQEATCERPSTTSTSESRQREEKRDDQGKRESGEKRDTARRRWGSEPQAELEVAPRNHSFPRRHRVAYTTPQVLC